MLWGDLVALLNSQLRRGQRHGQRLGGVDEGVISLAGTDWRALRDGALEELKRCLCGLLAGLGCLRSRCVEETGSGEGGRLLAL